jgi:hypothetical protein
MSEVSDDLIDYKLYFYKQKIFIFIEGKNCIGILICFLINIFNRIDFLDFLMD